MARHLWHITKPLKEYLSSRFRKQWRLNSNVDLAATEQLPAPLYIALMRGEAILKHEFFNCLDAKQITDPQSQQYAWQQLTQLSSCISEIIEKSEASQFFRLNTEKYYQQQCYNAYCIILWDAHNNNQSLRAKLTDGLVDHYLPTLYPSKAKEKTAEQLRKEIAKNLALQWHQKTTIKESFTTNDESVVFSIVAKLPKHSKTILITLSGTRLNLTRANAYKQCLKLLESEKIPLPIALTTLKKKLLS